MALSASYNYYTTRDGLITRALRIIGVLSQGETPTSTQISEGATTLNEIMKEWQSDGMQLWKYRPLELSSFSTGAAFCTIGPSGQTQAAAPPLRVTDAYYRNDASGADTPILIITRDEYNRLTPKAGTGAPNQLFYLPPYAQDSSVSSGNPIGYVYFFPAPTTAWLALNSIWVIGIFPFHDFDASTDQPDLPAWMINALTWGLADQLSYEYGVGLAERSMITKKAQLHKALALSFDQEPNSLFIQPSAVWNYA